MTRITRWQPFREMRRVYDMLDEFMDRAFIDMPMKDGMFSGFLPIDVFQTDDDVIVKATTPGIKPEDI
ncbi:MAG: Hsp20/alpha crystallin family protein, partial [Anaerolineales bacterium]|nr:Hsp20/alpha crystallin family protein [Anaerolineales bacterium]